MHSADSQSSQDVVRSRVQRLAPWILPVFLLIGFGPLLVRFFSNLWMFEIHRFFPMALLGAWVLAWRGLRETRTPLTAGAPLITALLTLLALALLTASSLLWSPWLGMVSFLTGLAATAWWIGGSGLSRALLPAWIMLFTVIPPPLRLDARLALALQQWAVAGSNRILDLLAVPHLRSGNILEIPGQRLLVEEACSGINSVLFMTAACVFYAMWRRRSLFFLIILYVLTIGFVLFGNLVRITSGAWLLFNYRIDLFIGWRHELLGLVLTASYFAFIVVADALLHKYSETRTPSDSPVKSSPEVMTDGNSVSLKELLSSPFLTKRLMVLGGFLLLLCLLQLFQAWNFSTITHERRINPAQMDGTAKFTLPPDIGLWVRRSEEKPVPKKTAFEDGVYSHIWQYERKGLIATISLDYPFFDYHDVRICYNGSGWDVDTSKVLKVSETRDKIPGMEVLLSKENGQKGTLLYSTVDQNGKWLDETGHKGTLYDKHGRAFEGGFMQRIAYRLNSPVNTDEGTVNYRIQLLAVAQGGLDSQQLSDVRTLFEDARKLLTEQFVIHPKEKKGTGEVDIISGEMLSSPVNNAPPVLPSIQKSGFGSSSFK